MGKETIIKGNKVIAKFMDVAFTEEDFIYDRSISNSNADAVRYHRDWNWIIPIVEKIIKTSWNIEGAFKECSKVSHALNFVDIKTLWQSVVNFIQWYNSLQTPTPKP